jgi:hypothetical protein
MSFLPFIPLIDRVLERILPDPKAAAEAKMKVIEMADSADARELDATVKLALGQLSINAAEAASGSRFVGGWRPAIGWVCAISLLCYYVPYVLVATVLWAMQCWNDGFLYPRPDLGIADLIGLVMSMLGMATLRTKERLSDKIPPGK